MAARPALAGINAGRGAAPEAPQCVQAPAVGLFTGNVAWYALAHARDVRQLMRTGRCGSGGGDTDGHLCRKRYWSYRMLVRAHPERALDMRGEDTMSETKPSAAQRGGGRAGGS